MSANHLQALGTRLEKRRQEARLSVPELAARARVPAEAVNLFERGGGGLGVAALARLARALGIPEAQLFHTDQPEVPAPVEPMVFLKASRGADLEEGDRAFLAQALQRAHLFHEMGTEPRCPRLADPPRFGLRPAPRDEAHEDGYRLAESVRALLPARGGRVEELGRLLESSFDILVLFHAFSRSEISGASCRWGPARLVVINKSISNEGQLRFALAHELAHHLVDLPESSAWADERADDFWGDHSPTEKRANAFAAMFLAPRSAVTSLIGSPGPGAPGLDDARTRVLNVRERFGLSFTAAAWHLCNLRYFDRGTAELLERTAPTSAPPVGLEPVETYDGLQRRAFDAYRRELISLGRVRELVGEAVASMALTTV